MSMDICTKTAYIASALAGATGERQETQDHDPVAVRSTPAIPPTSTGTTKICGVKVDGLVKDSGISGHGACESCPRA